jgi:hypothetical protein
MRMEGWIVSAIFFFKSVLNLQVLLVNVDLLFYNQLQFTIVTYVTKLHVVPTPFVSYCEIKKAFLKVFITLKAPELSDYIINSTDLSRDFPPFMARRFNSGPQQLTNGLLLELVESSPYP